MPSPQEGRVRDGLASTDAATACSSSASARRTVSEAGELSCLLTQMAGNGADLPAGDLWHHFCMHRAGR